MSAPAAVRACPVCSALDSSRKFLARDVHGEIPGEWWIRECHGCHSVFLETLPAASELAAFYPSSYYAYELPRPSRAKAIAQRALCYSKATKEPRFAQPGRMIDFGCGAGEFLLAMRARGWDGAGVEISEAGRGAARACGLDVRPVLAGPEGFPPASFDYVRANHSLEHVPCPAGTLREMYDALKPGGTLFLGVPTTSSENARIFGDAWWNLSVPLHTFVPSTAGIVGLVERSGFRVTRVRTNGDYAGTAGSLQIALNRGTSRRSTDGWVFRIRPLLLLGHWYAKIQDLRGVGDKLELTAVKPAER